VFLRTLGLDPSRTLQSCGALAAFYGASVALAFAAMSYTLWRSGGGTWRALILGARAPAPGSPSARAGHSYSPFFGPAPGSSLRAGGGLAEAPAAPRGRATIQVEMEGEASPI
jgi:hypothetical protein